jgi:hypothetical protein
MPVDVPPTTDFPSGEKAMQFTPSKVVWLSMDLEYCKIFLRWEML